MRRYGLLPLFLVAYLALGGCGTTALNNLTKNQACTTRVSGELAFGSITPTGKLKVTATCKPGNVPVSDVKPPAPDPEPTAADLLK